MPGTDKTNHVWPVWENGYVAKFDEHCECFCTDCNYTTIITAKDSGKYTLLAKTSGVVE